MNNIFNSTFEISLRILLILSEYHPTPLTSDMISYIDYICLYGKSFGIGSNNLHGDNIFELSEFIMKNHMINESLKTLIIKGLITTNFDTNGFTYIISTEGINYSDNINCDYGNDFKEMVYRCRKLLKGYREESVLALIIEGDGFSMDDLNRNMDSQDFCLDSCNSNMDSENFCLDCYNSNMNNRDFCLDCCNSNMDRQDFSLDGSNSNMDCLNLDIEFCNSNIDSCEININEKLLQYHMLYSRYEKLRELYLSDIKRLTFIVEGQVSEVNNHNSYNDLEHDLYCPFCHGILPKTLEESHINACHVELNKLIAKLKDLDEAKEDLLSDIEALTSMHCT